MIVDSDLTRFVVLDEEAVRLVLAKIDANSEGVVACVDGAGVLQGLLTDGDVRRWMIESSSPDLDLPVGAIINRSIVSAPIDADPLAVDALFDDNVRVVPLTDSLGRCVALAWPHQNNFVVGGRRIGTRDPCFLIAEIGINHNGSLDLAYKMIDAAVESGADCVKFQMRDLSSLYSNAGNAGDHREDLGSQYTLDLLSRFQLSADEMFLALDRCSDRGVIPLVTPWDVVSMNHLEDYGVTAYKTASAEFTNHPFLRSLARTGKPLICSTGMTSEAEIRESVGLLIDAGCQFALLHCNSTYPAPFKDVNLRYMETLREIGGCPTGYSSHDRGINVSVAAAALGANIIEKHFTLDKEMEGNDHRVSLLPSEFTDLVTGVREVESAMGGARAREITQGEMMNRETLAKSLVINTNLEAGEIIEAHMVDVRSPGRGLQPNRLTTLIGQPTRRSLQPGDILFPTDAGESKSEPRKYSFNRPMGIPVRYHDLLELKDRSNFDFLEFHLSYKDLEEDESKYFEEALDMDLIVHSPELFENDHLLDLSSPDDDYRQTSIEHLARVVELTRRLSLWFARSTRPGIVVNVGGSSQNSLLTLHERDARYQTVAKSLDQLDPEGVEILVQTMPPFPWNFGGQRFHNLFVDPQEIADFCMQYGTRVCFDTSHSKLACTHNRWSFNDFVTIVGPHVSHLHIADASGVDGEGLQILDGEIDFPVLGRSLLEVAPEASFIPEIWQGHKNDGEAFWRALELLEPYL